jgi:hypothetical protein
LLALSFTTMRANAQTDRSPEVEVVNNMFQAFGIGNIDAFTLSHLYSTVWNSHRSELIHIRVLTKEKNRL